MHLSTPSHPWGKPFTNKRYLHPPFAENMITMWPNSMILIGEITAEDPQFFVETEDFGKGFSGALPSAGVIFTLKRSSDLWFRHRDTSPYRGDPWSHKLMPQEETHYKIRKDGVPIHALTKEMDAFTFSQEAFCDGERISTAYTKVTVKNHFGTAQTVELGVLVRTGPEFLFTGCYDPDGYAGYKPSRDQWESKAMARYHQEKNFLTDGTYRLYFDQKEDFFVGGENDLTISLTLAPFESRTFTFALTRNPNPPKTYALARKDAEAFWKSQLGRANYLPDKKGVEPLFYNFLTQELQMFAKPQGKDYTIMRQGATQRFHWPEAKEMVKALSLIGGYENYIDAGLSHYFGELQEKEGANTGRIFYEYVTWNSRTAAALEMFADASRSNSVFFDRYLESAMAAFRWMERERSSSQEIEGAIPHIFPPGRATDSPFTHAQQWTFADTAMLRGYRHFSEILTEKNSPYAKEVAKAYADYFGAMRRLFEKFAQEQRDSEFLYLPRDAHNDPETELGLDKDYFHYLFPSEALGAGIAGYGTPEAEKLIHTYTRGGQSVNGLVCPLYRSTSGTGRTWYTSWSEHSRYLYYKECGNRQKCKELLDTLLKYNVSREFYQAERYDDHDAYLAPWMPNASANGRVLDMLFDYYGKRKIEY